MNHARSKDRPRNRSAWRLWSGIALACLCLSSCDVVLTTFSMPLVVGAGRTFVITIGGTGQGSHSPTGSYAGCVLQIPAGFTVVARGPGIVDQASLLQRYTAEPGHQLVSQSAHFVSERSASTHFVLRAPATPGTFQFKVSLAGYNGTTSYQAVDPVAVTNFAQITAAPHVQPLVVQPAATAIFAPEPASLPPGSGRLLWVDIDRDGQDDVVWGHGPGVWLARPGNTWLNRSPGTFLVNSGEVAVGDFDGDGHLDLVHGSRTVFYGDGAGNWTQTVLQPVTPNGVAAIGAGDFNGDGRCDILECDTTGWVRCLQSRPGRTFQSRSFGLPGSGPVQNQLALVDLDGDGHQDLVGSRQCWRSNGNGTWTHFPGSNYDSSQFVIGDVSGDSLPEVVIVQRSPAHGVVAVLGVSSTGQLGAVATFGSSNLLYSAAAIGDLDGDGQSELLLANLGIEAWRDSGGSFTLQPGLGLPPRLGCSVNEGPAIGLLRLGDRDGDGRPELIATSAIAADWAPLLWRNYGTGVLPYGTSCRAIGFAVPTLQAAGLPQLGNTAFAVDLGGGQSGGAGLLWFGLSRHTRLGQPVLPLPLASFGAPGCFLWAEDLAVQLLPLNGAGAARAAFPLPNVPALRYFSVFGQAAVRAPGSNPLGMLFSNALAIRLE